VLLKKKDKIKKRVLFCLIFNSAWMLFGLHFMLLVVEKV